MSNTTLPDVCDGDGLFIDGDWIESKDQDPSGHVRLIQMMDIAVGKFLDKSRRYVNVETANRLKCTFLRPGDILISRMPDPIGRACIFPDIGQPAITAVDVCIVRPNTNRVHTPYLLHLINAQQFRGNIEKWINGTTRQRISRGNLAKICFFLPSLSEQKRIAAILDKADAIRRQREKAIELTDLFLRSVFLEMFGDPSLNPKGWDVIKLESVFNEKRSGTCCGPFGSALKKHEYVDSGIPVWGIDNVSPNRFAERGSLFITPEKYAQLQRYNAIDGDILISRAGTVGRMCVCHPSSLESIIGTNLIRLSLNKQRMLPYYFTSLYTYFAARLPGLRSSGDPDAYSFLNTTKLAELKIPCPPIEVQRVFEQVLFKTRGTQTKLKSALFLDETLTQSLSSFLLKQNLSIKNVSASARHEEAHAL